jgi:hypothetical protein
MSNDIAVQPVALVRAGGDTLDETKVSPPARAPPQPAVAPLPTPNPDMRLDPALGMVVIEFRDTDGALTSSIPSQRQIEAYQKWSMTHFGPTPSGLHATAQREPHASKVEPHVPAPSAQHSKGK